MTATIIGGGISGLTTAYYLTKANVHATVIEKSAKLGGVIQSETQHGCLLEGGPDSFLAAKPWALDLITELGLKGQVIGSNDHLRVTYIVRGGKLVPLPDGLMMMVPTKWMPLLRSPLLSWNTKLRMARELFRRPANEPVQDRSVYDFLVDHYGEEANDYLAEPLLAGVYGGDPRELSAQSVLPRFVAMESKYGSLTRGVLAGPKAKSGGSLFKTLRGGLGQLIEALVPDTRVIRGEADAIEADSGKFRVRVNGAWMKTDQVVIATPAPRAALLIGPLDPGAGGLLSAIPYTSSVTLSLGYEKKTLGQPLKGFGFLVPKKERKHLVACTWVNNKFPFRAPDDKVVLRCFLGGALATSDAAIHGGS
jgi:oxygen-dependent protoporphyrinogen oxidase